MLLKKYLLFAFVASLLSSCDPGALPIEVQQEAPKIALASTVIDPSTVLVTATYSAKSLDIINDPGTPGGSSANLNQKMAVSNAIVVLSSATSRDTLRLFSPGAYGATSLNLTPYLPYTLTVVDKSTGLSVTSTCSYVPLGTVNTVTPSVSRTTSATTVTLHVDVQDDPAQTDYFVMSYSKVNPAVVLSTLGGSNFQAFNVSSNKALELFSDADAIQGRIVRDFPLVINATDTLYTSLSRIEKGFYEYLTAYKRSGSALADFGSEPVTLPTNVVPGLGYFFLNETKRSSFILKSY